MVGATGIEPVTLPCEGNRTPAFSRVVGMLIYANARRTRGNYPIRYRNYWRSTSGYAVGAASASMLTLIKNGCRLIEWQTPCTGSSHGTIARPRFLDHRDMNCPPPAARGDRRTERMIDDCGFVLRAPRPSAEAVAVAEQDDVGDGGRRGVLDPTADRDHVGRRRATQLRALCHHVKMFHAIDSVAMSPRRRRVRSSPSCGELPTGQCVEQPSPSRPPARALSRQ